MSTGAIFFMGIMWVGIISAAVISLSTIMKNQKANNS